MESRVRNRSASSPPQGWNKAIKTMLETPPGDNRPGPAADSCGGRESPSLAFFSNVPCFHLHDLIGFTPVLRQHENKPEQNREPLVPHVPRRWHSFGAMTLLRVYLGTDSALTVLVLEKQTRAGDQRERLTCSIKIWQGENSTGIWTHMFVLSCQWAMFLPPNVNDKGTIVLPEHIT